MKLFWGIAADGSVVISDNLMVIKSSCSKSFAPFPTGKGSKTFDLLEERVILSFHYDLILYVD